MEQRSRLSGCWAPVNSCGKGQHPAECCSPSKTTTPAPAGAAICAAGPTRWPLRTIRNGFLGRRLTEQARTATFWGELTASPVLDEAGAQAQFLCLVDDIRDRRERERSVRESEARLREFAETIDGLVFIADADREHFLYVSERIEAHLGRQPAGACPGLQSLSPACRARGPDPA